MGNSIKIHPVLLILSLLLGAKLFGILGLIFAVPMAAVCKVFYKHLWHQRSEETADDVNG
jgi:predicted PurR-regulated permease PerM